MYININPRLSGPSGLSVNQVSQDIRQFFSDTDRVFIVEIINTHESCLLTYKLYFNFMIEEISLAV